MNWIHQNTVLKGDLVELIPLQEWHFNELTILARESRIWEFIPVDMSTDGKVLLRLKEALVEREKGTQFPFVIYHKTEKRIVGSSRLMNIEPVHKKLEIGWTWLNPGYWATRVNIECKFLLLTFCFEELKTIRVQFRTDENNIRSRKAIQKIGAEYEGILRNDWIRENGTIRNTAYFSIIDSAWENAKENLKDLLTDKT